MVISMTGIGSAELKNDLFSISVEIKSYNSRFFDFSPKTSQALRFFDDQLSDLVKNKLVRGRIFINSKLEYHDINSNLVIDRDKLNFYIENSKEIKTILNSDKGVSVDRIMSFSDIYKSTLEKDDNLKELYLKAVNNALEDIYKAREIEGNNLRLHLEDSLKQIALSMNKIRDEVGKNKENIFTSYKKRISELLSEFSINEDRLYQEFAILLDKKDISEELIRLDSHMELYNKYIEKEEYTGKKMNFLLQEMNRETNTIGSKTDNINIVHLIVDIKSKLEEMKEQVQNIL